MAARQTPAVYRRRRILVFGGLLIVVVALAVVIGLIVARLSAADGENTPAPASSSSPAASPAAESEDATAEATGEPAPEESAAAEETEGIAACQAANIQVAAVTDADTYETGTQPQLSMTLTNTGSEDCTIDVGTATQEFTVASGDDVWWRSTDCQQDPSSMVVTLVAGTTVPSAAPVVWDRTRSGADTCEATDRPAAPGGGASYHVSVEVGGFTSTESKQIILN